MSALKGNFINYFLSVIAELKKFFPEFYNEAVNSLKKRKVKKYIIFDKGVSFYTVVGDEGDYLVNVSVGFNVKMSCTCLDYFYNVLMKKQAVGIRSRKVCYHIAGVLISILAEYAFMSGSETVKEFRKRSFLPEIILEQKEYLPIVLESIETV